MKQTSIPPHLIGRNKADRPKAVKKQEQKLHSRRIENIILDDITSYSHQIKSLSRRNTDISAPISEGSAIAVIGEAE